MTHYLPFLSQALTRSIMKSYQVTISVCVSDNHETSLALTIHYSHMYKKPTFTVVRLLQLSSATSTQIRNSHTLLQQQDHITKDHHINNNEKYIESTISAYRQSVDAEAANSMDMLPMLPTR